jgi:hypothetical protein
LQSATVSVQEALHVVVPQRYAPQSRSAALVQAPTPSHLPAKVAMPPEQPGVPHEIVVSG